VADGLGRLLLKHFFVFNKWGSLAMSAGDNPMNFRPILLSCMHKCILLLVLRFLWDISGNECSAGFVTSLAR
jgi:hypothetical protein